MTSAEAGGRPEEAEPAGPVMSGGSVPDCGQGSAPVSRIPLAALTDAHLAPGSVALIGGGPGAWDLITVRGLALLQQADVVVADRLGPRRLADELGDVEIIEVGKTPGRPSASQREIEEILVREARAGRRVARLKGGDPFVLGRGGEEVLACRRAGVDVQVVPGITSSIAGPAAGGTPVTHRGTAVALHVVNAHGDLGAADLAALRDPGTTTVLMMGVGWLPRLAAQARLGGADPDLPVAVVQEATLPSQRVVHGTLSTIAEIVEKEGIRSPAVIVAGRTAAEGFLDPTVIDAVADPSAQSAAVPSDARPRRGSRGGAGRDQLDRTKASEPSLPAETATQPVLMACSHGTRSREGRDVTRALLTRVAALGSMPVRESFVDVQHPRVAEAVAQYSTELNDLRTREAAEVETVVVPLLLSTGYHVRDDIGAAVAGHRAVAAEPLGPDARLATVMAERLREAGWREGEPVVLAGSGTRVTDGVDMVEAMVPLLAAEIGAGVRAGYAYAASPTVEEAVTQARADVPAGTRVAIASYMLAPGHFLRLVQGAGADVVAAPLGDHPLVAEVVLDRYLQALGG